MVMRAVMAVLLCAGAAPAQPAPSSAPSAEAKLIADMYGERLAQAMVTADPADNSALGKEMLQAAGDSANPVLLRHLLAVEVAKLCAAAGNDEGARLAKDAIALADKVKPFPPLEKARLELQCAQQRADGARKAGAAGKELAPLIEEVARAELALARALMREDKTDQANTVLASATARAKAQNLESLEEELAEVTKELRALAARNARIKNAEAQLQRARENGDAEAGRTARQTLGLIYLLCDGDIPKAQTYLTDTRQEYEACVTAAAAFLKDPNAVPDPGICNTVVESLGKAAGAAENPQAQSKIATVAMNLCKAFLAKNPEGLAATKARLLLVQMERLAGDSAADKYLRKIQANYKGLAGKLTVTQNGLRASYDFSNRKQLGDWDSRSGKWDIIAGKDVLGVEVARFSQAAIANRLRFHADKPLTLSFRASGKEDLTGTLAFHIGSQPQPYANAYEVKGRLGGDYNRESIFSDGGMYAWTDSKLKVAPNAIYRVDLEWDGQKSVTWTVNGKVLCKQELRLRGSLLTSASMSVGLETHNSPAAFDDVSVEGSVLEDPNVNLAPTYGPGTVIIRRLPPGSAPAGS